MPDEKLPLIAHLQELRTRLVKAFAFLLAGAAATYYFVDPVKGHLVRPVGELVFIAPQEAFLANIKIAFLGGALLASPFIIFQGWQFVKSALKGAEKGYALAFAPFSFLLFMLGASFGYFVIVPIGIKFLLSFASDTIRPMISISRYVSFLTVLTLAFGVIFELPLVSLFLTKLRIVTPQFLSSRRKYAVVLIFIFAAILTPPDVVTQCLMAVPLMILYEVGIIFSRLAHKR
jgi:sec-independent protein translocase protein TatC